MVRWRFINRSIHAQGQSVSIPINAYVLDAIFNAATDNLTLDDVDDAVECMTDDEVEDFMILLKALGIKADCHYLMRNPANEKPL